MKNYITRLRTNSRPWQICFWWVFRLLMVYALVKGFLKVPFDITDPLQVGANLAGMFAWEIFQAMPEKSFFRHIPSYVQVASVVGLFLASFGGKFMNFYYDIAWWDSALHLIGGASGVFIGYELVCAMQKRDKKPSTVPLILLASIGFSFLVSTAWELFEFTFDQIACMGGGMGDAQHWSFELAKGTAKEATLINPIYPDRWAIMDTMGDIVLNTIGATLAYVALKIFPYKHKGKCDLNKLYSQQSAQEKETVKK
ncbi:MAG: hypothetical protein GX051_00900 [Clostridiales bacterium]|nr:hypothetical protein [Clostridiales bacterium]